MTDPLDFLVNEADAITPDDALSSRERRELLIARRCGRNFGLFAGETEGIIAWKDPAPLPGATPAVLGLVCVRGRMFTVIEPRSLTGADCFERETPPAFLVLLAGEDQLGLAVEKVTSIIEVFVDEITKPEVPGETPLVLGFWNNGTETVTILNTDHLFTVACDETEITQVLK